MASERDDGRLRAAGIEKELVERARVLDLIDEMIRKGCNAVDTLEQLRAKVASGAKPK